jgi:glycosyltransferase involved in cell wall biosynthesis
MRATTERIAIFQHDLRAGGAERMMVNLAREWARRGVPIDLVLVRHEGVYLSLVPPEVRIVDLGATRTFTSLPPLLRYLRRERPVALLSGLVHVNTIAIMAKLFIPGMRVVISERNTPSKDCGDHEPAAKFGYRLAPYVYPHADAIIAVSSGVADDLSAFAAIPRKNIIVLENPVITCELLALARQDFPHSWFKRGEPPVILAVGRLEPAKDYPTLLRAFAKLRATRRSRLVILGEGHLRAELEALARQLGVASDTDFAGFVLNPYAAMSKAALLALSSRWEGSPNVLVEALACGLPVVATDCPSGPRETLKGGRYGRLVQVGDVDALSAAMSDMLDAPPRRDLLEQACRPFTAARSAARYLEVLCGGPPHDALNEDREFA